MSNASNHTPGPLFINGPYNSINDFFIRTEIDGDIFDIANTNVDETGKAKEYAILFAAAPVMLDTLYSVKESLEAMVKDATIDGCLFVINMAIAKAEGSAK